MTHLLIKHKVNDYTIRKAEVAEEPHIQFLNHVAQGTF